MVSPNDILNARVLIVDDQQANIVLLERTLRGAGYLSVSSTTDSARVCELHLLNRYDLILLDLEMPGMDGFQVMENLKEVETGGYLPVIVVTAQPGHKLRALRAGARDFVSKPLDLAEVLARAHNVIEVRLLHMEARRLYDRVLEEQRVSERLLLQSLPESIAERLKPRPASAAAGVKGLVTTGDAEVTVLFSDLVEFTRFAEGASAEVLRGVLDDIATRLGGPSSAASRLRSRTIGEAYLRSVGLSDSVAIHTIKAAEKALDLVEALDRFNARSRFKLRVSIGIETGPGKARPAGKGRTLQAL